MKMKLVPALTFAIVAIAVCRTDATLVTYTNVTAATMIDNATVTLNFTYDSNLAQITGGSAVRANPDFAAGTYIFNTGTSFDLTTSFGVATLTMAFSPTLAAAGAGGGNVNFSPTLTGTVFNLNVGTMIPGLVNGAGPASVPEPSSFALFGVVCTGLIGHFLFTRGRSLFTWLS